MSAAAGQQRRTALVALLFVLSIIAPLHILADSPAGAGQAAPPAETQPASTPPESPAASSEPVDPTPAPSDSPAVDQSGPDPGPTATARPTEVASPSPPAPDEPQPSPTPAETPAGGSPSPEVEAASPSPSAEAPVETIPYVITFASGAAFDDRGALLAGAGVSETASIDALHMVTVDVPLAGAGELIAALRTDPAVARMEPDRERTVEATPDDPRFADQWALPRIGWQEVYDDPPSGSATVAVLDTGVDPTHPDLAGRLATGTSFVEGAQADADPNGHGTWMAGIVGASTDNGEGIAGTGAGALKVMPVTVIGADGSGLDSDIIEGLVYAVDHGADVVLMAFSNHGYSAALQAAVDYAWQHDVVVVAATGNDGSAAASYPAGDAGVVGVSATEADDSVWPRSNSGASVFLAAPGAGIVTTSSGGAYGSVSGTSAAAAYVAAAAGLLRARDGSLSNGVIVGRLARTAADVGSRATAGNGRLDLGQAWADTSSDSVYPAGAHDSDGGPFVGPYDGSPSDPGSDPGPYAIAAAGFRAAAQNGAGSGVTSLTISKPSGTITGDVMVASIGVRPSTVSITAPAGWTLIRRTDQASGNSNSQAFYYKIATASEGASYTWTVSATSTGSAGGIATFNNVSSCAPVDVSAGQANASALTQPAPSVTTTQAGDMLLTGHSFASAANWAPPAGMTEAVDVASIAVPQTTGMSLELNYQLLGAAGATGIKTATAANDADTGVGVSVALRSSCTKTWDGGAGTNNWGDANNWNPNGVPTASDDVSLTGANTINVNLAGATNNLTMNNASLVVTVNSGQSLTVGGNLTLSSGTLNTQAAFPTVGGTTTIAAASTIGFTAASGSQTIPVRSYGNLVVSGGGTKTLAGTITPAGNLSVNGGTLDVSTYTVNRASAGGTLTVSNGATLKIGGTGTLPSNYATHSIGATSTIEYAGTATAVAALNSGQSYGNLTVSGSATTTAASFAVNGTLTVSGSLTPAAASVISGTGTLTGSGTVKVTRTAATAGFANQYTITNKTLTSLTVEYAGGAAQVLSALTYGGLTVNNASGLTMAGNATATTLNLVAGKVTTGAYALAITSGGAVSRTSGYVFGRLQRGVPAGASSLTFDVGDATTYAPVTVSISGATAGGSLTANTTAGDHPQLASSAINPARSVNRFWTLTGSGFTFTTYDATLSFAAGDVDAGASTGSFIVADYAGATWTSLTAGTRTATSTQAIGATAFGDLAVGQPDLGIFTDDQDIGGPALSGSAAHSSGTYTVNGAGNDIWNNADQFNYIYRQVTGDVRITARLVSLTNTDGWAKAGVMIRESTAAGSVHAFAAVTPSNGMAFQWRPTTNGASDNSNQTGFAAPYWVRLTRIGDTFTAERSPDGINWTQQGTTQTISMASSLLVGLAVTSHNTGAVATGIFDNVSIAYPPTANADSYLTQAGVSLNVNAANGVLVNDTDPLSLPLSADLVTNVGSGSLTLNADGSFSYTPNGGFTGSDTFTYRAYNGQVYSAAATVTLNVVAGVGFEAEDYVAGSATGAGFTTVNEGSALNGQAITTNGNNTNGFGPPPERVQYDVYFPDVGATNSYHLYMRYRMQPADTNHDSGWALAPLDADPTAGGSWDQINDLYLNGSTSYAWVDLTAATSGINGVVSYDNVATGLHSWWFGGREAGMYPDAFAFATAGSLDLTATGQAYLDQIVNDRPTANADGYSVNEDNTLNVAASGVLGNDTDPESDPLTAVLVANVSNGSLTLNANGSFSYTPNADFNGSDSFTYRAKDRMVTSLSAATVTISVNPVNDVPSFVKGADQSVNEDAGAQSVAGWATAISAGPADESGQSVNFIVSNDNNGLFAVQPAVSPTGTLSYTPAANANGSATVSVQIHDDGGTGNGGVDTSAAQTFTITVNAVNDAPVNTVPGAQTVAANGSLVFSTGNANAISVADLDAGTSQMLITLTATNGTLTLSGTAGLSFSTGDGTADATMTFAGTLTDANTALEGMAFAPTPLYAGPAGVQILTSDQGATGLGGALSDTDGVSITVTNTPPVANDDAYSVVQDTVLLVAAPGVLGNDTDPDGQPLSVGTPRPVSGPTHGSLTLNADGSFSYTPSGGYTGPDAFTYVASDGYVSSAAATVTISVNTNAYVSDSGWAASFSASRYLDLTFPAYVPMGSTVEGATFTHAYRSHSGGTTCYYFEVWAGGILIGTHGSAASPVSCSSGSSFVTDSVSMPEVDSAARADALTVRLFVRNSVGGQSEHAKADLGVTYYLSSP